MPTTIPTTNILVTMNSNGTWSFANRENGEDIANGDLTAHRNAGHTTFNFVPAPGQNWTFVSFTIGSLTVHAPADGRNAQGSVTIGNTTFDMALNKLGNSLFDENQEIENQTYEYSFVVTMDGREHTCDPKIYNKSN